MALTLNKFNISKPAEKQGRKAKGPKVLKLRQPAAGLKSI